MRLFLLQIVDARSPQHPVIRLPAGGVLERDLILACTNAILPRCTGAPQHILPDLEAFIEQATAAIVAKGVGVFRTEAHVTDDIRAGLTEVLTNGTVAYCRTEADLRAAVEAGITAAISELKGESVGAL